MASADTTPVYKTAFGSLDHYEKGGVQIIDDDVRHYAFSNCFEIASKSKPYEKVVFGQNQIYVLETLRAEGSSPWYTCAHDEFALVMDGEVDVHLVKLDAAQTVPDTEHNGAVLVEGEPRGQKMGWMKIKRGHQALHAGWSSSAMQKNRRPDCKAITRLATEQPVEGLIGGNHVRPGTPCRQTGFVTTDALERGDILWIVAI